MLAAISRTRLRPSSTPKSLSPFALHSPIEFSAKNRKRKESAEAACQCASKSNTFLFPVFSPFCTPWEKDDRHFIEQFQLFRNPARMTYIVPQKQAAKRHDGSHQYFTKRAWNVIQAYINHFTQPGDAVCDPYAGTGVTVIEALSRLLKN